MKLKTDDHRTYRKNARADAERATGIAILKAARRAFLSDPFDRVTLNQIAEGSGVTVQTVLRRFGSKEELFKTFVEVERPKILASRESRPEAGLSKAIAKLIDHYEKDGDLILNLVAQEKRFELIASTVTEGRDIHRKWVETHCAEFLGTTEGPARDRALAAAIAATDLGTWKLLRRDLGRSKEDVVSIMSDLIHGIERRTI